MEFEELEEDFVVGSSMSGVAMAMSMTVDSPPPSFAQPSVHTFPSSQHTSTPPPTPLTTTPPATATQTALTSPDILDHILEHLALTPYSWSYPPDDVVSMRRTLRNAALVNKRDWLEPSLDRLWRSLDKLFPLFRLLRAFWRSDSTYVSASLDVIKWMGTLKRR